MWVALYRLVPIQSDNIGAEASESHLLVIRQVFDSCDLSSSHILLMFAQVLALLQLAHEHLASRVAAAVTACTW